jgi:hypothetical protein
MSETNSRESVFNAIDEVDSCGEWHALRMHLVRKYILALEEYTKQLEQDYDDIVVVHVK